MIEAGQAWRIKVRKDTMVDQDRELKQQARKLHNMFKVPGMVSQTMAEDLLRWIIDRAVDRAREETAASRNVGNTTPDRGNS